MTTGTQHITLSLTALLMSVAVLPLRAEGPESLLVSGVYADSSVVAPVLRYSQDDGRGTQWRVGLSGWTVDGEWTRRRSATSSLLLAADATPLHAHNSDRIFEEGRRMEQLDYENASYRLRGGLRFHPNNFSELDVMLVALQESVSGLPAAIQARWSNPYAGAEVAYRYSQVRDAQPLISSIDGMEVEVRAEVFAGEEDFVRISAAQHWGNTIGRFHLRQSAGAVHGDNLDFVNSFLIGGSWDALGGNAVYGLRQGELRTESAAFATFGADVQLAGNWWAGPRISGVISEDLINGYAFNVRGSWRTFGLNGGVVWVDTWDDTGYPSHPELYVALIVPLYRR